MVYRVFISYCAHDLAVAAETQQRLRSAGVEVCVAEFSLLPGSDLRPGILKAIRICDLFLLLWSKHAKGSDWVAQEVGVAHVHRKPTITILLGAGAHPPACLRGLTHLPALEGLDQALAWLREAVPVPARRKMQAAAVMNGLCAVTLWLAALDKSARIE
jgi:hypothetical protein